MARWKFWLSVGQSRNELLQRGEATVEAWHYRQKRLLLIYTLASILGKLKDLTVNKKVISCATCHRDIMRSKFSLICNREAQTLLKSKPGLQLVGP